MPCLAFGENLSIVSETYKRIALAEVARFAEGLPYRIDRRIKVQDDQTDDGGSDKANRPYGFPLFCLGALLFERFLFHKSPPYFGLLSDMSRAVVTRLIIM